jgi:transcriptional regulator of acetoin/glycerol metabolism
VQIVSISESQLFPLVWQKAFLDDLYYRLNMVCVALDGRPADSRTTLL